MGTSFKSDLLTGHGRLQSRCQVSCCVPASIVVRSCAVQNTYIYCKCLLNTCRLMESRGAGGFLPVSSPKKSISNSPHLTMLAEKEEAGVCPRAEAVFGNRRHCAKFQIHLTDLPQYVLLSRGKK